MAARAGIRSASCRPAAFALWLALTIAVLLCASRRQLSRLPVALGSLAAVLLAALIALLGAAMLHQLDRSLGYGLIPASVRTLAFASGSAAIAALISAVVLRYLYVIDGWQAQVRASARAEADALQARIKPHFLFNSMNTIAGLVRHDPVVAERAVLDLSDLFRAALGAGESDSSLREEVELAERYLAIEALRLGERLQVEWRRLEPLPWPLPLPRLVLQPLRGERGAAWHLAAAAGRHASTSASPPTRPSCTSSSQSVAAPPKDDGQRRRAHATSQHRPSAGVRLRPARAHDVDVARGLLSLRTRHPIQGERSARRSRQP